MDKYTSNVDQNARGKKSTEGREKNAPEMEMDNIIKGLKEGAKEGAKQALNAPISKKVIEDFKRSIKEQPDDLIGEDLNDLMQHIGEVVEKHPNELVLVRLLWAITLLGSAKCLGGFGKSLMTLAMIKALTDNED